MKMLSLTWLGLFFLGLFPPTGASAQTSADRPNIVLILADDLGYGDPGAYNAESKVPTPHLDRLAAEGMRFTDAHTPSSVCTPTRYGILTGRYAWRSRLQSGVLYGYGASLIEPGRMTVASLLKEHGYRTGAIGKWHLGFQTYDPEGQNEQVDYSQPLRPGPTTLGFNTFFGIPASLDMVPYLYVRDDRPTQQPTDSVAASAHRREDGGGFWRGGPAAPGFQHIDVLPRTTDEAVAFIEAQADSASERPFFLYFPLSAPHTPWLPTEDFRGASQAGYYGDFAAQVDATVGAVLEALERTGQADNTLVFFTSDNGAHWLPKDVEHFGHHANGPFRGQKADVWEGGHRVPFIARWPGRIAPGSTSDETICLTDFFATFAALLETDVPEDAGEDSYNLLPVLLGQDYSAPLREATVHHSLDGLFAIRQGPWKLILGRGSGGFTQPRRLQAEPGEPEWQLYHLGDDPAETRNLYAEHPDVVGRLATLLLTYRAQGHSQPSGKQDR